MLEEASFEKKRLGKKSVYNERLEGGSAGQLQDIGLQMVAVGLGQEGQTVSMDFGPGV